MFINQLDIKEFRGIKECKEPLKLSKFNVLIGRNNAGKSTVLGGLSLLPIPYDVGPIERGLSKRDFLAGLVGGRNSLVYAYSGEAKISYEVNEKPWETELDEEGGISLLIAQVHVERHGDLSSAATAVAEALNIKPDLEYIRRLVFFIPNSTTFLGTLRQRLKEDKYWNFVVKQHAHFETADKISECVDDKYTEILIYKEALCARKELPKGGPFYIKLEDLGDGIKKAVAVMLFVNAFNPHVILWDDFEASAHPSLIKMLLKWLSSKNWQVVLSTHSIDVLDRLIEVKPKDAKIIQLKKTSEDILLHKELTIEEMEDLMEANQDPRLLVDALEL
jgi:energy-coupling factor transporter ATP-binding protein EcfA2